MPALDELRTKVKNVSDNSTGSIIQIKDEGYGEADKTHKHMLIFRYPLHQRFATRQKQTKMTKYAHNYYTPKYAQV